MSNKHKSTSWKAIEEAKEIISSKKYKDVKFKFRAWIPKGSDYRVPIRFYIENSPSQEYIFKHNNKLIISCEDKNRQLLIENFLFENDIDLKSMKSLGELDELLKNRGLLVESTETKTKKIKKRISESKQEPAVQTKLKKGDKLHVMHGDQELIITITHIESQKGVPTVNLSSSGSQAFKVTTDIKNKANRKRTHKINGSNKGRGWSKSRQSVKK